MKVYFSAVAALLVSSIVSAEGGNDSGTAGVLEAVGDVGEENKQPVFCGVSSYDQQRILNCTIAANEKVNSTLQDYINRFGANHTVIAAGICNNTSAFFANLTWTQPSCVSADGNTSVFDDTRDAEEEKLTMIVLECEAKLNITLPLTATPLIED
uniref:Putative salivary protein n=1 Tax=Ixodes ricinus TaxID=34613 RepID=A0A147BVP7_IXORI